MNKTTEKNIIIAKLENFLEEMSSQIDSFKTRLKEIENFDEKQTAAERVEEQQSGFSSESDDTSDVETPVLPESAPSLGPCPECGSAVIENQKSFYCSSFESGCKFTLWKDKLKMFRKSEITPAETATLLAGQLIPLEQLKNKKGKIFNSEGKLVKDPKYGWTVQLVFEPRTEDQKSAA